MAEQPTPAASVWRDLTEHVAVPSTFVLGLMAMLMWACDSPSPHSDASASRVRLTSIRDFLPADGGLSQTTINAFIVDREGEPVSGATVTFGTTLGILEGANPATSNAGDASIILKSTAETGIAVVTANVFYTEDGFPQELRNEIEIRILNPKYRVDLRSVSGLNVIAANSSYPLRAQVFDTENNLPAPPGVTVAFQICDYQLQPTPGTPTPTAIPTGALTSTLVTTGADGIATVNYVSPSNVNSGRVIFAAYAGELIPPNPESCPPVDQTTFPGYAQFEAFTTSNTATPTPTSTPTPTATPTIFFTATPTPTPTVGPGTPTSTPLTPTSIFVPTATPDVPGFP